MSSDTFFKEPNNTKFFNRMTETKNFTIRKGLSMDFSNTSFAKNFKRLRQRSGLSQQQIASIFNVDQTTISKWENGERNPSLKIALKISEFFGTNIENLFTGNSAVP